MAKASSNSGAVTIRFGRKKAHIKKGAKKMGMSFNTFVVRVCEKAATAALLLDEHAPVILDNK